jgi:hypothetical protein
MKSILFTLIVFASIGAFAKDILTREFVPLESFGLTKASKYPKDSISDEDSEYLGWRCLGLTAAVGNINLKPISKKDKQTIEFFKETEALSAEHAFYTFNDANKLTQDDYKTDNPYSNKAKIVLRSIVEKYLNIFQYNFKETNSYFDTQFLRGDIDTCGSSFQMIYSLKKK